ncbi:MAG: transporter substrate-binding domain-containing protein [Coriobacteriales bacterium]|jgi:polar amino acid transport system substrate-binding protein|nr:transporter substrate-binding domain-containing protein [Coriobacteriales bacterium]
MELRRRTLTGILSVVLAAALLGLTGCFGFGGQEQLVLPAAKIKAPSIAQDGVLRVGIDPTHAPFAGRSGSEIIGIDVDVAAALAEQMGLELVLVETSGQDVNALLRDGAVDVVMSIQSDSTTSSTSTTSFSEVQVGPYLVDGPAFFAVGLSSEPQAFDSAQLNGMTIAAQEGSLSAWQVGKDYGDGSLLTFPSLNGAFDELASGRVSYAAADAIVGSFLAIQYENVRCEGLLAAPQGVYMGVAADKSELATALTEALRSLRDSGNLQVIIAKWLGPVSAQTVLSDQAIVSLSSGNSAGTTTETPAPAIDETLENPEETSGETEG